MNIDIILKNKKFKNLLNEIELDDKIKSENNENTSDSNDNICLISQTSISNSLRKITLPCGHTFDYVNLFNEIKNQKYYFYKVEYDKVGSKCIKCPYCRKVHDGVLPYHEVDNVQRLKWINEPNNSILPIHQCSWTYQSGKQKGKTCSCNANMYKNGIYCEKHYKSMMKRKSRNAETELPNVPRCQAILKSGKNKGSLCNCKIHSKDSMYCKRHTPKS